MRYQCFFTVGFLLSLAACSGNTVKETLGLDHKAPDEYRVVSRPPLSVPPEFSLRPPAAPGDVPAAMAADKQAKSLLTGKPVEESNTFKLKPEGATEVPAKTDAAPAKVSAETNFLQRAGATQVDPDVRTKIEQDKIAAHQTVEEDESWWDTLSILPGKKDSTVDAEKEAERIKENKDEGKSVSDGDTPEVKASDHGILGKILGY
jgi:Protein of unknown function (DUF3035)